MFFMPQHRQRLGGLRLFLFLSFFSLLHASTLQLSISSYPSRLNPLLATDTASSSIADWVFASLVKYDKDANIVGDMAEHFYFKDPATLIFRLKAGLTWHDGAPVSAEDVVFTYETIHSPSVFTPYTSAFRTVASVKALDALTVEVRYKEPYFKALETWMMGIIPKHLLKDEKELMTASFNQHPIGSNSFRLEGFDISRDIELFAFKGYLPHKPYIDRVVYRYVQDPSTEFLMLKSFQLDIGSLTPLQFERQIDAEFKSRYHIIEEPAHAYTYLGFNLTRAPFDNPKIRQALNLAIDRDELVDILFFGHGTVCHGPFLDGAIGYNSRIKTPKTDVPKAKALLAAEGFDKTNPLRLTITTNANNPTRKYTAIILQNQLQKAGIEAKIRVMEWQSFLNRAVHARDFDLILLGWSLPLMPDPYNVWHSESDKKGGFNFVGYHNEEVDRLIKTSESIVDRDRLDANFQRIFELIANDLPYLFLYIPNAITVVNKNISPVIPSIIGVTHNKNEWRITR
jgi:peptide/nickel transport system substrate-binding protein